MGDERRVIVIGSGPAGAMAARALAAEGIAVLLLESGDLPLPRGIRLRALGVDLLKRQPELGDDSLSFAATGDPGTRWYQALVPGGLSNYWAGTSPRFAPQDFTEGEQIHEKYRWPLTYEELLPHYEVAERVLCLQGSGLSVECVPGGINEHTVSLPRSWVRIASYAGQFDRALIPTPWARGPGSWDVTRAAAPCNSYSVIIEPLARSRRIEVLMGTHAMRLEWDGAAKRVKAVVVLDRTTGRERRLEASAFVVAGGTLSTTLLLLNSRSSDFPDGLGNTEGVLGRYLHDHPMLKHFLTLDRSVAPTSVYLTRRAYRSSQPLRGAAYILYPLTHSRLARWSRIPLPSRVLGVLGTDTILANSFGSMVPDEGARVTLGSSVGKLGLPTLNVQIAYDEDTRRTLEVARGELVGVLEASGLRVTCGPSETLPPGSAVHFGGTVRLHDSPKYGMLDRWSRMHAVPNVAVVDASAFTTPAEKNPTPTLMALADRAARRLARDLRTGA